MDFKYKLSVILNVVAVVATAVLAAGVLPEGLLAFKIVTAVVAVLAALGYGVTRTGAERAKAEHAEKVESTVERLVLHPNASLKLSSTEQKASER